MGARDVNRSSRQTELGRREEESRTNADADVGRGSRGRGGEKLPRFLWLAGFHDNPASST